MDSKHCIRFADAADLSDIPSESVHLVVTSPPYPMIEMWDPLFRRTKTIDKALRRQKGRQAFELMHLQLDRVWEELHRVLVPGGVACINIGDATRTLDNEFALYPNHSRILTQMISLGCTNLPNILWRKQTNAPNKFMGSGMMPPGAYITLEHEYVLIFRKGGKRLFKSEKEKFNRRQSAFFWEERNHWFSDVWMDLKGTRQKTGDKKLRQRSGAFPFELAYRLICMFSVMGDTVLDPFLGTGTTMFAAACANRNSVGVELDKAFRAPIDEGMEQIVAQGCKRIAKRFRTHERFVQERTDSGKQIKYTSKVYGFPVITRQEIELFLPLPESVKKLTSTRWQVSYQSLSDLPENVQQKDIRKPVSKEFGQLKLFE